MPGSEVRSAFNHRLARRVASSTSKQLHSVDESAAKHLPPDPLLPPAIAPLDHVPGVVSCAILDGVQPVTMQEEEEERVTPTEPPGESDEESSTAECVASSSLARAASSIRKISDGVSLLSLSQWLCLKKRKEDMFLWRGQETTAGRQAGDTSGSPGLSPPIVCEFH